MQLSQDQVLWVISQNAARQATVVLKYRKTIRFAPGMRVAE